MASKVFSPLFIIFAYTSILKEMTNKEKSDIKKKLKEALSNENEVSRIVVFGSFLNSKNPNDIDVAIFQDSKEIYLKLAIKYRRLTREIAKILPIDIIPLKSNATGIFLNEINSGEVIYER